MTFLKRPDEKQEYVIQWQMVRRAYKHQLYITCSYLIVIFLNMHGGTRRIFMLSYVTIAVISVEILKTEILNDNDTVP